MNLELRYRISPLPGRESRENSKNSSRWLTMEDVENFEEKSRKGLTRPRGSVIVSFVRYGRRHGGIAQLARACGSYPQCPRFKSRCRYQRFMKRRKALHEISVSPLPRPSSLVSSSKIRRFLRKRRGKGVAHSFRRRWKRSGTDFAPTTARWSSG
mgnify:CR=1 FL=1